MVKKKEEPLEPEEPRANIRFVGRDREEYGKTIPAEALRKINHGQETIMLPGEGLRADTAAQAAGFFHPRAAEVVRLFSSMYKLITEKGN